MLLLISLAQFSHSNLSKQLIVHISKWYCLFKVFIKIFIDDIGRFLSNPVGAETVWQGVFILRALIVIRKEDGDPVAATIELQGYREGWSIPEFFYLSERDWDQLGPLRSLLNVESSSSWGGWFESTALYNCLGRAFRHHRAGCLLYIQSPNVHYFMPTVNLFISMLSH